MGQVEIEIKQAKAKRPISPERHAQLVAAGKARARAFTPEYQKAAGQALKAKVSRSYYQDIGRRGGRLVMYRRLMRLATSWSFTPEEIAKSKVSAVKRDELVAGVRRHYEQEARKYLCAWGQRLILAFYAQELETGKPKRARRRKRVK